MKRAFLLCLLLILVACALWFRWSGLEIGFDYDRRQRDTVEATASERVVAANGGRVTVADRARAADRARWKAYYYAQLRAAELQGALAIESGTQITNLEMGSQTLKTATKGQVRASPMADDAVSVVFDGDVVRARVALEVDAQRPQGRMARLRSFLGSVRLRSAPASRVGTATARADGQQGTSTRPTSTRAGLVGNTGAAEAAPVAHPAALHASRPESGVDNVDAVRPMRFANSARVSRTSGYVVVIPRSGPMVGVFPAFYDSRGTPLGSADDLAPERRLAGLPLLGSNGSANLSRWVGTRPSRYDGTVSRGDVFLRTGLAVDEARAFREALVQDRVVILVDEDT